MVASVNQLKKNIALKQVNVANMKKLRHVVNAKVLLDTEINQKSISGYGKLFNDMNQYLQSPGEARVILAMAMSAIKLKIDE